MTQLPSPVLENADDIVRIFHVPLVSEEMVCALHAYVVGSTRLFGKTSCVVGNYHIRPANYRCSQHVSVLLIVGQAGDQVFMTRYHGIGKVPFHHDDRTIYLVDPLGSHPFLRVPRHFVEYLFAPQYLKETSLAQAQVDISQARASKNPSTVLKIYRVDLYILKCMRKFLTLFNWWNIRNHDSCSNSLTSWYNWDEVTVDALQ